MATKTFDELIAGATAIKNNELPESNTHNLVGGQLIEMATKHKESDQQSDVINVTTKFPLAAGSYYTSSTARAAVTSEYRKLGKKLLYQTDATTWVEEKFIGSATTDTIWNAAANWLGVASKNDIIQLESDLNQSISNLDSLPTELITPDVRTATDSNIGYVSLNNGIISTTDNNYRYTPLILVQSSKIYKVVTYAPNGYCLYGYSDTNHRNPVQIANTMFSGQITIPEEVNYIQISCKQSNLSTLSLKSTSIIRIYESDKKNMALLDNIPNAIPQGTEFVTQSIYDQTSANSGFIHSGGGVAEDVSYRYTPYIKIYPGIYSIVCQIFGGASIVAYDEKDGLAKKILSLTKTDGKITIPDGYNYIRFCTVSMRYCSLRNDSLITLFFTKEETIAFIKDARETIPSGTSLIGSETSYTDGQYISAYGTINSDIKYTLTEKLKVYPASKIHIIGLASAGYCIGGYKRNTSQADTILKNGYSDVVFTVPDGVNYIRVSCRKEDLWKFQVYYEESFSLQAIKDDLINLTDSENIDNLIHEKGRELITDEILTQTTANTGWIDSGGILHSDSGWYNTPYLPVYLGTYQVNTPLYGGASIVSYDENYNSVAALKTGTIGDGVIAISGGMKYIKISTTSLNLLSLKAIESIFDYNKMKEYSLLNNEKFAIRDNLKNSQEYFRSKGLVASSKYSHAGAIYNIPLKVRRPTAISFKFRIDEDVNTTDSFNELIKLAFANGDHVKADIMKGINSVCFMAGGEDAWVSYDYYACVPRYNSGFRVVKNINSVDTIVSTEKRFLTRKKPLVGKDAFRIRYKGILDSSKNGISIKITSTDLVIFNGSTIIASYPLVLDNPVKELIDRMRADMEVGEILENYEIETFEISQRKQSELLKISEIKIVTDLYYGGLQSWGAYIPYAIDETWHTCEIYMDNMQHQNPVYNFNIPVFIVSIDGVQTEIYPNSTLFGDALLTINGGEANIQLRNLEIQDGQVDGYERNNDPSVSNFISNYSKRIIGLMGHHVLKAEEGSDEIINSGYGWDMSTDRLVATKRKADKMGYTMITIKDIADYYDGKKDIPNKCFFWIFDDIEIDLWYNKELRDIFITNGIVPCLALVNSGTYGDGSGRPDHDNVDVEAFYLQHPNAIKDMRSYGWIPHMHGFTHTQIDALKYEDFVAFINNAKTKGEEQGLYTDIYTYSYGPHSVNTAKYMEHKGIRLGVTTTNIRSTNATGRYCISRINASDHDNYPFSGIFRDWMEL